MSGGMFPDTRLKMLERFWPHVLNYVFQDCFSGTCPKSTYSPGHVSENTCVKDIGSNTCPKTLAWLRAHVWKRVLVSANRRVLTRDM